MASSRNSVKKRVAVTPAATPLPDGPCDAIWLTTAATVTGELAGNEGVSLAIAFPAEQWIPESFRIITAVSTGTCYAGYAGGKAG